MADGIQLQDRSSLQANGQESQPVQLSNVMPSWISFLSWPTIVLIILSVLLFVGAIIALAIIAPNFDKSGKTNTLLTTVLYYGSILYIVIFGGIIIGLVLSGLDN